MAAVTSCENVLIENSVQEFLPEVGSSVCCILETCFESLEASSKTESKLKVIPLEKKEYLEFSKTWSSS